MSVRLDGDLAYRQELRTKLIQSVRLAAVLIALAAVSFAFVDPFLNAKNPAALIIVRGGLLGSVILIGACSYTAFGRSMRVLRVFSYLEGLCCGFAVALLTLLTGGSASPYWPMQMLTFFGTTLVLRYSVTEAASVFLTIFCFYNVLLYQAGESPKTVSFVVSNAGILLAMVVSVTAAGFMRSLQIREFTARQSVEKTNADLQKILGELAHEKEQSERLLLNILPETIAARLRENQDIIADR